MLGVLHPGAGVTGGHGHHRAGLGQILQNGLVNRSGIPGGTRTARTQRQVHRVTVQDNGILNGGHVVGIVSAASGAEYLHGDKLSIRCDALGAHRLQRRGEGAIPIGNVPVSCGNTGHMGAVLTLGVVVMYHIQVRIYIVKCKGELGVEVCLLGLIIETADVQLRPNLCNLRYIQEMETLHILLRRLSGPDCILLQGVVKGAAVEGLVVGVGTGVDDGDPAASTSVTSGPGDGRANHLAGGAHIGIYRQIGLSHIWLIPGLNHNLGHPGDLLQGRNLAIGHVGRDDVGSQGQVPDHIQLLARGLLNLGLYAALLFDESRAVRHRRIVMRNVFRSEACPNGGGCFHHNRHTDHIGIGIVRFLRFLHRLLLQTGGNRAVVYLRQAEACTAGTGSAHGGREAAQQCQNQQHGKQAGGQMHLFHTRSPFSLIPVSRQIISTQFPAADIPQKSNAVNLSPAT